ncbi:MAG: replication protein [Cressdnaviricota sp.]|nr:MAG: replication protein [Cressdnaviricota sp.]
MAGGPVIEDSLLIDTNLTEPTWVTAVRDVEMCTLRLEKRPTWQTSGSELAYDKQSAWFTCKLCPQPHRYERDLILRSKTKSYDPKTSYILDFKIVNGSELNPIQYWDIVWGDVIRCKKCNRTRSRYRRGKKTLDKIVKVWLNSDQWEKFRPKFVTLTTTNDFIPFETDGTIAPGAMADLARSFKSKITNFRRTKTFKQNVIGGVDYIEQVYNIKSDGIDVNTHSHHVWLGKYWKQKDFQDSWGHGIVQIQDCTSVRSVMKYISKYITKDDVKGSRCKETFGVIRGE